MYKLCRLGHASFPAGIAPEHSSRIATFPVITVTLEDDLHIVLRRFTQKNIDEIPVVEADDPTRVIGMLRRKESISAYHDRLAELRGEE